MPRATCPPSAAVCALTRNSVRAVACYGKKGKPVQIGKLEQFIADFDTKMNLSREKLPQKTRGRVAVIGSGPAGLTVAGDLARQGFNVTIFRGPG